MSRPACSVLRLREKMANPFLPNRVGSKCDCTYWKTSEHITHKQPFETSPFKVFKEFFFVSINMLHDQYFVFLSQLQADPHAGIISFSPSLWSTLTLSPTLPFFYYARRGSRIVCLKEEGLNYKRCPALDQSCQSPWALQDMARKKRLHMCVCVCVCFWPSICSLWTCRWLVLCMAFLDVLSICVLGTNACTCVW
jgi:hypothetical protein